MIKSIEIHSIIGWKPLNEDSYAINEEAMVFGVFDGATSICPYKNREGKTGGFLASRIFSSHFSSLSSSSIKEELIVANQKLKYKMIENDIDLTNSSELWCTAGIALSIKESSFEYVQVADCMLMGFRKNGGYDLLTTDKLKNLDERLAFKRQQDRKTGIQLEPEEYYQIPAHSYQYMRTTANTLIGYSVANGDEKMKDFIQYGKGNLSDYSHLLLFSDGVFYPEALSDNPFDSLYKHVSSKGLTSYLSHLSEVEEPYRYKDDKTAILITL